MKEASRFLDLGGQVCRASRRLLRFSSFELPSSRPPDMTALRCLWTLLAVVIAIVPTRAWSAECNDDTMRQCRKNVLEVLSANGYSEKNEVEDQCKSIRENFDCVLWQTSMCLDKSDQDANGDVILKSWRYMTSFCETQGSWWTKACYQREDVKRCEALLPTKSQSMDTSSCRSYSSFRDCVISVVEVVCSGSDQRLLGTYLMDKGQQRAWRCPKNNDAYARPASAPLAQDSRQQDSRYNGAYASSDAAYGSCVGDSRAALQDCASDYETRQSSASKYRDSDMRNHMTCCGVVRYEECVQRILRERCGETLGDREAKSIVATAKNRLYSSCDDHTMEECSAAADSAPSWMLRLLLPFAAILLHSLLL